jgi:4-hydroxybenzoate polyprenyltransferase
MSYDGGSGKALVASGANRWIVYQRERFPFAAHAPLVAAFSVSAVSFSALLRTRGAGAFVDGVTTAAGQAASQAAGQLVLPTWRGLLVAYVTSLLFFLQLRIADEHKDCDEDARYRPYRPVPRGLVTLRELTWIGIGSAIIQLALALWLSPALIWLLLVTWIYFAWMTREFFARDWLKARPVAYLFSHMLIMPLIDLYATACDWWPAGYGHPPDGLFWFLIVSFFNGLAIEIGRKIRAREDEEHGVETYSKLWGPRGAIAAWMSAIAATAVAAFIAATLIGSEVIVGFLLFILLLACVFAAARFLRTPSTPTGKGIEVMAGIWTLGMYLSLGVLPLVLPLIRRLVAAP